MASNCTLGIQNLVKTTLNNKPWFEYDQSLGIVNILDSPKYKINKQSSFGVAKVVVNAINKQINNGYKNIGEIAFVKSNKEGRGYVDIAPTINQIYLINAQNEEEIYELQKQLDKEETLEGDLQRKETGNYDVVDGEIIPLDIYFQKNEDTSTIDTPKDFKELFNSLESISSVLDLLNKPIFNNFIFDEYYLTETNKDRFKSIFIKEGLDEKSVDFIINFIEENRLQREKLSVVIGKIKQNLIFKSKGLNYYNAILTQQADNKLDEFLVNFLKDKLSVNVVKNSIEHYGSAMAVADILNKVILINNKNLKTLPEETGHFFFELLGQQNKLQLDLLNNVKKWEGYSMIYEKYKTTYVTINENGETTIDEEKIKREAVGQAIGEAIVRNYKAKNGDTFFSLLQEAVDFIKNLLNKLGLFNFEGTIDEIAKDILNQDISKIKQIKDDNYQKRTFKDTLANYPELQQMIDNFINIGAKLTGSLGYRDAGDLFRPLDEDVHDLDFRIYKEAFGDNIENFLNKVLKIYPQMKIRTHANGKHMMWTTKSKNLALLINIDGLLIDLFFYNYNSNNKESTVSWYESFKEKYQIGRPKDMNDILRWANFTPINLADSTKPFVYYQLNEDNNSANIKPGVEELFNENSELSSIGTQQQYSQYLDSLNKPNTNPILQGNQNEQVKKFVELQERLNNKEFIEGAKNAYESSKGLQEFGTQEQYNDYIARVSLGILKNPSSGGYNYTSKVKDIVYHDSPSKIEEFKKSYIFTGDGGQIGAGFYFWNEKTEKYNGRKFKIPSLINLEKPLDINSLPKTESSNYFYSDLKKRGYDILAIQNYTENYFGELRIKEGYEKAGMEDKSFFKNMEKEKTLPYIMKKEYDIDGSFSLFGQNNKQFVVFEPEQIHILGGKQDIEGFKDFVNNNNQKTEDYFSNEINKIQEESKIIENSLKEYETSKKIDNRNTTKAIKNKEEKAKEISNKLLSLGFEFINENEYQFSTSSYITFKSKLNSLEGIDVSINTFKSPDYLIKIKIKPLKNNFDLQKQGELPFNPIELKLALKENDFIQDIADNTFEGLTEEQIKILRDNLENGELNLNCKI